MTDSAHDHEHDGDGDHAHEDASVTFINPEFNIGDAIIDDLGRQNAEQAKQIAILRGQNAQMMAQLRANADKLGLIVAADGSLSTPEPGDAAPQPSRAVRRAGNRAASAKK